MARSCKGQKDDGSPCQAPPGLVDPATGFCPSHGPGARERMAERGRKGATSTARYFKGDGIDSSALPPLDSHEAAMEWLEVIGRAVAGRKLSHNEATAAIRAVSEWVKTKGDSMTAEVVEDLRAEVERLKAQLEGRPRLRVK